MSNFGLKTNPLILANIVILLVFIFTPKSYAAGTMDIYEGEPSVDDCRKCHGDDKKQPHPLLQESNKNRHHDLVGKPVEGLHNGFYESIAPGDISSGVYECISCHEYDDSTPIIKKDCLACHPESSLVTKHKRGQKNVHHGTEAFKKRDCRTCHRFLSSMKYPTHKGMYIYKNGPTESECRRCHGDNNNQPHPALKESNVNRHHDLIGDKIEGLYNGFYDSVAPGDKSSGVYECLSCHKYENYGFVAPRDCMSCHIERSVISRPRPDVKNVHHNTQTFRDRNCKLCHWF